MCRIFLHTLSNKVEPFVLFQDRLTSSGVDAAVDNFLRAAGMFRYIRDNFSNAPSMDLSLNTLDTLIQLMLVRNINKLRL